MHRIPFPQIALKEFETPGSVRLLSLFVLLFLLTGCLYPTDPTVLQEDESTAAEIAVEQIEEDEVAPLADVNLSETLVRTTFLLDREVENVEEQDIGEVEDFILDEETGRILYVVLEYGGFLDIGDADLAIPPAVFTWNDEAELVLPLTEAELEGLPAIGDEWPALEDDWDAEIRDFWLEAGFIEEEMDALPLRIGELLEVDVSDGAVIAGVVEDLLFDLSTNRARYLAVRGDVGFWEEDTQLLIPFTRIDSEIVDDERLFFINVDVAVLEEAPRMNRELFLTVDFIEPALVSELDRFWEAQIAD